MGYRYRTSALCSAATRRAVLLASAGLAVTGSFPFRASARQQTDPDLLVRGAVTLSGGQPVAWRVVSDVAEVAPDAAFERRALGFAVNTSIFTPLLVTDEATGTAFRLLPGEAAFTPDGVVQRRESLGGGAESYLRIALVPGAQANDAGGDRLRFAGPSFAAPAGIVTLALVRAQLGVGDAVSLPASSGDALVIVEQGEAVLETAVGSEPLATTVGSDTAYAVRSVAGAARLVGQRSGTSVLLAVVA